MQLVLASSSRYRRALLERLALPFTWTSPEVDERPHPGEPIRDLVGRLARAKAMTVARSLSDALVIGSDQAASHGTKLLTKPGTERAAVEQLVSMSGATATFYTAHCLLNTRTGATREAVETVTVTFRRLTRAEVEDYVARERPLDAAGSFKAEGLGIALFERIESHDPTTLIGLPLIRLTEFLSAEGMPVLAPRG